MINWEELKHIHVIRKLQGMLAQWFQTEILFVDERGEVRNFDFLERSKDFKNPLSAALLPKEKGRELLFQHVKEMTEKAFRFEKASFVSGGPIGCEQIVVSRIAVDQEFLGTVYAFCYIDRPVSEAARGQALSAARQLGLDEQAFGQAVAKLKVLSEGERKYFHELVDLVAQEIVTFHIEISKREERIHALNHQLGSRYSYDSMIGKSKPMQELYAMLDKIKASESTVLVNGENGTGKELIARAIHFNSRRKDAQFVTVNCYAFNDILLDSVLFGHV
ncbi:MAG: sigma 54-interacting transcriptional regulator, partial [Oligoflexia bacterium]